jgi:PadR family transcriptional regulator, regulatory protein PadR
VSNTVQRDIQTKLAKGLLDMIILDYLRKEAMHGYQIISKIRKNFNIYLGPSTIYPLLCTLEKKGYVESSWNLNLERPRRTYKLTDRGKVILNYTENSLNMICKTLSENEPLCIQRHN